VFFSQNGGTKKCVFGWWEKQPPTPTNNRPKKEYQKHQTNHKKTRETKKTSKTTQKKNNRGGCFWAGFVLGEENKIEVNQKYKKRKKVSGILGLCVGGPHNPCLWYNTMPNLWFFVVVGVVWGGVYKTQNKKYPKSNKPPKKNPKKNVPSTQ